MISSTRRPVGLTLLAGLAAIAVACGSNPPGPTSVPSPSAAAGSPSPSAASIAPSASTAVPSGPAGSPPPSTAGDWTLAWPPSGGPRLDLAAVIASSQGFVSVGADVATHASVALSSADGSSWTSESIKDSGRHPTGLARWGDRIIAFGSGDAPCAHPVGLDTWVRSATGAWTEAPFANLLCYGTDVSVAVVDDHPIVVGSGPGDNAVVWSSTDGLHWVDHSQAFAGLLPRAVTGDGQSAVLFAEGDGGAETSSTTDGSAWTVPVAMAGVPQITIDGAFWIDGAPLVVASSGGVVGTLRPASGGGWDSTAAAGIAADQLRGLVAFDGGLIAIGGADRVAAWVSRDGAAWRAIALPEALAVAGANVAGVAIQGGHAVLVGSVPGADGTPESAIWTGSPDLLAP